MFTSGVTVDSPDTTRTLCFGDASDQQEAASTERFLFAGGSGFAAEGREERVAPRAPDHPALGAEQTHLCSWKH